MISAVLDALEVGFWIGVLVIADELGRRPPTRPSLNYAPPASSWRH